MNRGSCAISVDSFRPLLSEKSTKWSRGLKGHCSQPPAASVTYQRGSQTRPDRPGAAPASLTTGLKASQAGNTQSAASPDSWACPGDKGAQATAGWNPRASGQEPTLDFCPRWGAGVITEPNLDLPTVKPGYCQVCGEGSAVFTAGAKEGVQAAGAQKT